MSFCGCDKPCFLINRGCEQNISEANLGKGTKAFSSVVRIKKKKLAVDVDGGSFTGTLTDCEPERQTREGDRTSTSPAFLACLNTGTGAELQTGAGAGVTPHR